MLRSGADGDRIAAEKRGQHGRGDAQVDARHLFADAIHIEGAAAHAAELFGNEQELNAQFVRTAHMADDLERTFVALIQLDRSSSSGRRFLAKSLSDFKLSFSVLFAIMGGASLC